MRIEAKKAIEETKKNETLDSEVYTFKPKVNDLSEAMVSNQESVVTRTLQWQNKKLEKIKEQQEDKSKLEEEKILLQTQPIRSATEKV